MNGLLQAYKAIADPGTTYFHEAMNEKDRNKFCEAMGKEVKDQMDMENVLLWNSVRMAIHL